MDGEPQAETYATTPRPADEEARTLVEGDWLRGIEAESRGNLRAAIANAMVGLKKHFYGKGPTKARTFINENYVFCVLEGGTTRNEQTLIARGHERVVREYRECFQEAMRDPTVLAIERLTGRRVVGYHSQIVFQPDTIFEIFRLDAPPASDAPDGARASG